MSDRDDGDSDRDDGDSAGATGDADGTDRGGAGDRSGSEDGAGGTERDASGTGRHGALTRHPTAGPFNSIFHWTEARNPLRVMANYVVVVVCRVTPSMRLKNWLLRRIGVTVGTGAAFALESTPDVFWPELVTVEAHAIVGYDATLLCHEFLQDEYRTGEVVVGERAMVGAGAVILPGVEIGSGAQVAANSLVAEDVPPGETVAGVPATPVGGGGTDDEAGRGDARPDGRGDA
ncbi:MAG: acetyltransferase [Haloarculaceae archaeon]